MLCINLTWEKYNTTIRAIYLKFNIASFAQCPCSSFRFSPCCQFSLDCHFGNLWKKGHKIRWIMQNVDASFSNKLFGFWTKEETVIMVYNRPRYYPSACRSFINQCINFVLYYNFKYMLLLIALWSMKTQILSIIFGECLVIISYKKMC